LSDFAKEETMRYMQLFLVSLVIALLITLTGDTLTAFAHGRYTGCQWHYVRRGETLSGIGRRYGVPWRMIAQYNRLYNPNYIRAGAYLCVPTAFRKAYSPPAYGSQQPIYPPPTKQPPTTTPPATATVTVQVRDFEFVPNTVTIHAGDTVVWTRTQGFHNVLADDGSFGNQPSDTWGTFTHTFTTPGMVRYYCQIHGGPGGAGMAGLVIVQ
jgi:plastocyanin